MDWQLLNASLKQRNTTLSFDRAGCPKRAIAEEDVSARRRIRTGGQRKGSPSTSSGQAKGRKERTPEIGDLLCTRKTLILSG